MTPVAGDDEIGDELQPAFLPVREDTGDAATVFDEADRLGFHHQTEVRVAARVACEEVEKVPLRHQRDEAAMRGHMAEVGDLDVDAADHTGQLAELLVRALQEVFEQAELVDHLERRGMHRVAAEIAQEVAVLLEDDDIDARTRHQEAEHHAGGAAADDRRAGCGWSGSWEPLYP